MTRRLDGVGRRACFEDDEQAWAEAHRIMEPRLVDYMVNQDIPFHDAQDIAAQAFLVAWLNRKKWDPKRGGFATFLMSVARGERSHWRTYRSYPKRDWRKTFSLERFRPSAMRDARSKDGDPDEVWEPDAAAPSVEERVAWRETLEEARALVGRGVGRRILEAYLEAGQLTNAELAARLGRSIAGTKMALQDLRRAVRPRLDWAA